MSVESTVASDAPWEEVQISSDYDLGTTILNRDGTFSAAAGNYNSLLRYPFFRAAPGYLYKIELDIEFSERACVQLGVLGSDHAWFAASQTLRTQGRTKTSTTFSVLWWKSLRIYLENCSPDAPSEVRFRIHSLTCRRVKKRRLRQQLAALTADTLLPHWGPIRRFLHNRCKSSAAWNAVISAAELRLGMEEVVSLPQFMALCPTGRCNANCVFCSVEGQRDGITKRDQSLETLQAVLTPVQNTLKQLGLEGNGEPTIYRHFAPLMNWFFATFPHTAFYLISNGEFFDLATARKSWEERPGLPMSFDFSLNAATPETQRSVMNLNCHEAVVEKVRDLMLLKPYPYSWQVCVSMVMHHGSIHEVQDFLRLAESRIRPDQIHLRPLSELATADGAVEDPRAIVPYQCEINDTVEAVAEYLEFTPRVSQIIFDPAGFQSVRPDPVDRVLMPKGFDGRLLPPRRNAWTTVFAGLEAEWGLNRVRLRCAQTAPAGVVLESAKIPVEPGRRLTFRCRAAGRAKGLHWSIRAESGAEVARLSLPLTEQPAPYEVSFDPGQATGLILACGHEGGAFEAEFEFDRLYTPPAGILAAFTLPKPKAWQIETPGTEANWTGSTVRLRWDGAPGPYLYRSRLCPCHPQMRIDIPVKIQVESGKLVIGVLSEDSQRWTNSFPFPAGSHDTTLRVMTGDNRGLRLVLYSAASEPLRASVDWGDLERPIPFLPLEAEPSVPRAADKVPAGSPSGALAPSTGPAAAPLNLPAPGNGPAPSRRTGVFARLRRAWTRAVYCQKPWTDMHNFTTDGRMDVCCIATGPSQSEFALGNLGTQHFQQIWNGPVMQRFRGSVNTADKLSPCQRCPMAYAYQGLFFSPALTREEIQHLVANLLPNRVKSWASPIMAVADFLLRTVLFRGFRRS